MQNIYRVVYDAQPGTPAHTRRLAFMQVVTLLREQGVELDRAFSLLHDLDAGRRASIPLRRLWATVLSAKVPVPV